MGSTTLTLVGRYRLDEKIAAGGAGEVWRGHDTVLARTVAVKLLRPEYAQHPETLARFRAEARHAGALSHPGIAQVFDYGEDRQPFLVMEMVDGPSLGAVLATRGQLDARTTMDIAAQAASALSAAHAAGLVHRDIKPANLLVGPGGRVKITDFGIAHAAGSAPLTRTGTLIGTPAYLAPERVAGKPATAASDLYSLGIVCYECLMGTPPFTGTAVEVALAHQHGELPTLPSQVPAEVAALVTSLTARDPLARPPSAAEAADRAARLRDALPPAVPTGRADWESPMPPPATAPLPLTLVGNPSEVMPDAHAGLLRRLRSGNRRAWTPALAVAVVAIIAGLAGWLLAGGPGASSPHKAVPADVTPAAPRLAQVNQSTLVGQPVSAVSRQLRHLGMRVRVVWQYNGHEQPGTVISVQPTGRLPVHTTVSVTGALAPPGHGDGQGNGDGNGNRGGNGNGGGQGS